MMSARDRWYWLYSQQRRFRRYLAMWDAWKRSTDEAPPPGPFVLYEPPPAP